MSGENISQELRLENIKNIYIYLIKGIDPNELISNRHKKVFTVLNYTEHFLILVYVIAGLVSISTFASLLGIPKEIMSFAIELKICEITIAIKKYKLIIKKKKMKYDKMRLSAKLS